MIFGENNAGVVGFGYYKLVYSCFLSFQNADCLLNEKVREDYLRKQREMELRRNQEEAFAIEQEQKCVMINVVEQVF